MAYLDQTNLRSRPSAVAAVIAIHGMIGYALVTGLSFEKFAETMKNPDAIFVLPEADPPPPPPPPPTETPVEPKAAIAPLPYAPPAELNLPTDRPTIDTSDILLPPLDDLIRIVPKPGPTATPGVKPAPTVSFDPLPAKPSNEPGTWVTPGDYRSSWINREMEGLASFKVSVGANGRVTDCTITRSSGHSALDEATCENVTRRAHFEPARDANGDKVAGTYSNTVKWQIPD